MITDFIPLNFLCIGVLIQGKKNQEKKKEMRMHCDPQITPDVLYSEWKNKSCAEKLAVFNKNPRQQQQEFKQLHDLVVGLRLIHASASERPCWEDVYRSTARCFDMDNKSIQESLRILDAVRQATLSTKSSAKRKKSDEIEIIEIPEEDENTRVAVPNRFNILVIGMIYVSPNQYNEQRELKKVTYPPPLRDFHRLEMLQRLFPEATIYTMNLFEVFGIQTRPTHIEANISTRGARALIEGIKELFGVSGRARTLPNFSFRYVLLDYFRFPPEYMTGAYTALWEEGKYGEKPGFLDLLADKKWITDKTEIFVPRLKGWPSFCKRDLERWQVIPVQALSNPLYRATRILEQEYPLGLGGYSNSVELERLDPLHPFDLVKLRRRDKRQKKT